MGFLKNLFRRHPKAEILESKDLKETEPFDEGIPKPATDGDFPPDAEFSMQFLIQMEVPVHPLATFTERVHAAAIEASAKKMGIILTSLYYPQKDGSLLRVSGNVGKKSLQ